MASVSYSDLQPPFRVLLGPGPSNVHPRVQRAMVAPLVGHMDPYFFTIMDDIIDLMRFLFQTRTSLPSLFLAPVQREWKPASVISWNRVMLPLLGSMDFSRSG